MMTKIFDCPRRWYNSVGS